MVEVFLRNLTKYFGKVCAVEGLNLEIKDREFMVLLGPSGCGKTTTLLMIAGLYKPTAGDIYFGDALVNDLLPRDRNVGMVFQSYALYPHMQVFDNIAFPLKLKRVPKDEIKKRVRKTAEFLKIENLLDRKPAQLSGGQQQRVALGRALIKEPEVFLMDEPLANLDAKLRVLMRVELKKLQKRVGITTIYVTHDQVEAMTMADRITVMNEGRLQQVGESEELYLHPRNLFVAGFIGSPPMNFMDCTFIHEKRLLDFGEFRLKLPSEITGLIRKETTSEELILGVRPEHLRPSKEGDLLKFTAEVYAIEPLGKDLIVNFSLGKRLMKMVTSPPFEATIGEEVQIGFDVDKMHIFDKKTEKAII